MIPSSARRARRVVESSSSASSTPAPPLAGPSRAPRAAKTAAKQSMVDADEEDDYGMEEDVENEDVDEVDELEEDAEGEDYESEEDLGGPSGGTSAAVSEDRFAGQYEPSPPISEARASTAGSLKIKFKFTGELPKSKPTPTLIVRKDRSKKRKAAESEDDLSHESSRSASPTKLTARQQSKNNKDISDALLELPAEPSKKAAIELTEAERQVKREEMARRRKRQTEQKIQDEQEQTINRLLRAQTGRSRTKIDAPTGDASPLPGQPGHSRLSSPSKRVVDQEMIRTVYSIAEGKLDVRLGIPEGKEWVLPVGIRESKKPAGRGICAIAGCGEVRKYRCTQDFHSGGCSLSHLKEVEAGYKL